MAHYLKGITTFIMGYITSFGFDTKDDIFEDRLDGPLELDYKMFEERIFDFTKQEDQYKAGGHKRSWFVMFYSKWSGESKAIAPVWQAISTDK